MQYLIKKKGKKAVMLLTVVFLFSIMLTACGKQGEEFVGKWKSKGDPNVTAKISRAGGSEFKVKNQYKGLESAIEDYVEYKNGRLINQGGGSEITYNKETGTITMQGLSGLAYLEWTKIK